MGRISLCVVAFGSLTLLAGCSAASREDGPAVASETVQPIQASLAVVADAPAAQIVAATAAGPTTFVFDGQLEQGGWLRGQAPAGTVSARLGSQELPLDPAGRFFAAFDRDAPASAELVATLGNGRTVASPISVAPRSWNIERVNVARRSGGPSASFMERRRPELEQIYAARMVNADSPGWSQDFIWPVTGRISGRFGSQRIYRGEPGSYHTGIDIAGGDGTPYVSPADGVVTLATTSPFSLEGYLLIIDHGQGLNSAFLHSSRIVVRKGDVVKQGQYIGNIGASGRATGPHLHWGLKWRDTRLDPLLFTGPMN